MLYELETDVDAAKRNYLNAQLTITGEVGYIAYEGDIDDFGREWTQSVIAFQTYIFKGALKGSVWEQLYCYADLEEENQNPVILNPAKETGILEQVEKVKLGDNVTVRGIAYFLQYGEMYLDPCEIVD